MRSAYGPADNEQAIGASVAGSPGVLEFGMPLDWMLKPT
jgi:hypothetical protein